MRKTLSLNSVLIIVLAGLTLALWGNTLYIKLKAHYAAYLIDSAWESTLEDQENHRPWSWADTWPVAKIRFDRSGTTQSYFVLEGSQGNSLAFAPGHVTGTALPSEQGTIVIGGHRDTHFAILEAIQHGDVIELQDKYSNWHQYRVDRMQVTNTEDGEWAIDNSRNELHLITCYPFHSLSAGGSLRYVVVAHQIT